MWFIIYWDTAIFNNSIPTFVIDLCIATILSIQSVTWMHYTFTDFAVMVYGAQAWTISHNGKAVRMRR